MPTYIDGDSSTLNSYIVDSSGNLVPYTMVILPAIHTEITEDVLYKDISFDTDMSFSIALQTPIKKGQWHILCGITRTGAARRYVRSVKRQKEKERRRRLKYEARICSDVR